MAVKYDYILGKLREKDITSSSMIFPVVDTTAIVKGSVDSTKLIRFEVDSLTTGTTRVLTVQDSNGTIAYTTDIISDHTLLSNIGTNTHAQIDTHIADTTIHFTQGSIDHGSILGLADDDHTQYLLVAGTRGLSANWDAGSYKITALQLESDIVTGTAPLIVASTTVVTNLNADLLDGIHASAFLQNLVEDTTPQLGGDLDLNGKNIDFPSTPNISDCLDEDTMVSNSATALATQQSIKAYVDNSTPTVSLSRNFLFMGA